MGLTGKLPSVKSMYWSGDLDWRICHFDLKNAELRTRAAITKDKALQAHIAAGDVYSMNALDWYGAKALPRDVLSLDNKALSKWIKANKPEVRQACKVGHLGFQYMAGPKAVYPQFLEQFRDFKFSLCTAIHAAFQRTYARTVEWAHEEQERVAKCGYSEDRICGFRRYYPPRADGQPPPITETSNYPNQTGVAAMIRLAMRKLRKELRWIGKDVRPRMAAQCHDAIDIICHVDDVQNVLTLGTSCIEQTHVIEGESHHFPCDSKVALFWDETEG